MTVFRAAAGRTRWDIVALALTAGYVVGMQFGKVPPALPMLQAELDLPRVAATGADVRRFALGAWSTYMPIGGMALSLLIATALPEPRDLHASAP